MAGTKKTAKMGAKAMATTRALDSEAVFAAIASFVKGKNGKVEKILKLHQPEVSNYSNGKRKLTEKAIKKFLSGIFEYAENEERKRNAAAFFGALKGIHGWTDKEMHEKIIRGKSSGTSYSQFKDGRKITSKMYSGWIGAHTAAIFTPIFEYQECCPRRAKANTIGEKRLEVAWKLFDNKEDETKVKDLLYDGGKPRIGVYAMYDSSGRLLYFGKAESPSHGLYKEILQRLKASVHRDVVLTRNGTLKHLGRGLGKKTKADAILVGDMTKYISAYEVTTPHAIANIEAFVLHLAANDLVNFKVERIKF